MFRFILILITFTMLISSVNSAQQSQTTLANADIVKMTKSGLSESLIVKTIQTSKSAFDVSPDALIELNKQGVGQTVLDAMISATSAGRTASGADAAKSSSPGDRNAAAVATPSASVPEQLWVKAQTQSATQALVPSKTSMVESKSEAKTMSGLAADSALGQVLQAGINEATYQTIVHAPGSYGGSTVSAASGIMGGLMTRRKPTFTYVWAVPGSSSASTTLSNAPSFEVHYAQLLGIEPSEYQPVLLKFTPTVNDWLLVGATRAKQDNWQSSSPDWQMYSNFIEERIATNNQNLESGHVRISPASPLAPGQYGIAFRPVSKSKKFAGTDFAKREGAGLLFSTVWAFTMK